MHIKVAVSKINCRAQQLMHPHFMAQQFQAAPFSTGVSDKLRSNLTSNLMLHLWNQYLQSQPMCQHATLLRFEEQSCHIAKQFCCELSLTVTAKNAAPSNTHRRPQNNLLKKKKLVIVCRLLDLFFLNI